MSNLPASSFLGMREWRSEIGGNRCHKNRTNKNVELKNEQHILEAFFWNNIFRFKPVHPFEGPVCLSLHTG